MWSTGWLAVYEFEISVRAYADVADDIVHRGLRDELPARPRSLASLRPLGLVTNLRDGDTEGSRDQVGLGLRAVPECPRKSRPKLSTLSSQSSNLSM